MEREEEWMELGFAPSLPLEVLEMILKQLALEDLFCLHRVNTQTEALVEHWFQLHPPSSLHFTHFLTGLWRRGFNHSQAIGQVFDWMAEHFKDAKVLSVARITMDDLKERSPKEYLNLYSWSHQLPEHLKTFLEKYSPCMKLDSLLVEQTSPDGAPRHSPCQRTYLTSLISSTRRSLQLRQMDVQEPLGADESDAIRDVIRDNSKTLEVVKINCSNVQVIKHREEEIVRWARMASATRVVRLHHIPDTKSCSILIGALSSQDVCSLELLSSDLTAPFPISINKFHSELLISQRLTRFHFSGVAVPAIFERLTTYWPPELKDLGLRWEPLSPPNPVWFSLFATRGAKVQSLKVWSSHPEAADAVGGIVSKLPGLKTLDLSAIPSISKEMLRGILADLHPLHPQISLPDSVSFGSMAGGIEIVIQYDK